MTSSSVRKHLSLYPTRSEVAYPPLRLSARRNDCFLVLWEWEILILAVLGTNMLISGGPGIENIDF